MRFLTSARIFAHFVLASTGLPETSCQWSNTHYGNAYPAVSPLKWEEKPKDSETGR